MMRRALREIVDPSPDADGVTAIWSFFDSRCAYCGAELDRSKKEGHIDHLTSASRGGLNNISNRVLSCANCNEKEKLDLPWEQFLGQKVDDPRVREARRERILAWQGQNPAPAHLTDRRTLAMVDEFAREVATFFEDRVEKARGLRRRAQP